MKAFHRSITSVLLLSWSLLAQPAWAADACAVDLKPPRQSEGRSAGDPAPQVGDITERAGVGIAEFQGNYDRLAGDGAPNVVPREAVANQFFAVYGDDYDFLIVVTGFDFDLGPARAIAWRVRNDVEGINIPIFDETARFGSSGRLRTYVDLGRLSSYVLDPLDPQFDTLLVAATHEILHTWGAAVRFRDENGQVSSALTTGDLHWSYLLDSDASVLYGADWRDNRDGTFTAIGSEKLWSPLDLYLAGLLEPASVPPFRLLENDGIDPARRARVGESVEASSTWVNIEQIEAVEGPRWPSASESPQSFRAGLLYLTPEGVEPSSSELVALERFREELGKRFAILTGGRASLETYLAPQGDSSDEPPPIDPGDIRPEAASLLDALAWLRAAQTPDGSWSDTSSTRVRDTAIAAGTLARLDAVFSGGSRARDWLSSRSDPSHDYLARSAGTLRALGGGASAAGRLDLLASRQNADGGWGSTAGFGSDPVDTSLVLRAFVDAGRTGTLTVQRGADFLVASQNSDGGWGYLRSGSSRVAPTALALAALERIGRGGTDLERAVSWLAERQNEDGGFGDSPSTAHDTALAVAALLSTDVDGGADGPGALEFLRTRQTTAGSWEGSVYTTALVAAVLADSTYADLAFATSLAASKTELVRGEPIVLSATVVNAGSLPASASTARFELLDSTGVSSPAGAETLLAALLPGQQIEIQLRLETSALEPGTYTAVVVLDADHSIEEVSETNNRSTLSVSIEAAPSEPDPSVEAAEAAFLPHEILTLPTAVSIVAPIRNLGSTDVVDLRLRLYRGEGSEGIVVEDKQVDVPALSTVPVGFSDSIVSPGTTSYTLVLDPDSELAEASESNNVAILEVTTTPSIDLAIGVEDLSLLDSPVYPGGDARFRFRARNRGTTGGGTFEVRTSVTDGVATRSLPSVFLQLEPGESEERTVVWRADLLGDLRFVVVVDPSNLVPEGDESNNRAELPFRSDGLSVPNLTITPDDFSFAPNPGEEGRSLTISLRVRNNGGVASAPTRVVMVDGEVGVGPEIAAAELPSIGAGSDHQLEFSSLPLVSPTDRVLFAVVDPDESVDEFSETDNSTFQLLPVRSLPDLTVTSAGLSLEPAFPIPGEPAVLTIDLSNLGEQAARSFAARVFDGDPSAGGAILGETTVDLAGGGLTTSAAVSIVFAEASSSAELTVRLDADAVVAEGSESNNQATLRFAVQESDFHVDAPYFSPNGDGELDTTTFSFRVDSTERPVAVEVRNGIGRLVRRVSDPVWASGVGDFEWDGRDDRGRLVIDAGYRIEAVDAESGEIFGGSDVTLDNDLQSLLDAIGTPYEQLINTTCGMPWVEFGRFTADGKHGLVVVNKTTATAAYPHGIYRVSTETGVVSPVVNLNQLQSAVSGCTNATGREIDLWSLRESEDGNKVAFRTHNSATVCAGARSELFVVEGSSAKISRLNLASTLTLRNTFPIGFYDQGRKLLIWGPTDNVVSVPLATPSIRTSVFPNAFALDFVFDSDETAFSPDRSRLAVIDQTSSSMPRKVWMVNLETGAQHLLAEFGASMTSGLDNLSWTTDGSALVVNDSRGSRLLVFNLDGSLENELNLTFVPSVSGASLSSSTLSRNRTSSTQAALQLNWSIGNDEYVLVDLATAEVTHVAWSGDSNSPLLAVEALLDEAGDWQHLGFVRGAASGRPVRLRIPYELRTRESGSVQVRVRADDKQGFFVKDLRSVGPSGQVRLGDTQTVSADAERATGDPDTNEWSKRLEGEGLAIEWDPESTAPIALEVEVARIDDAPAYSVATSEASALTVEPELYGEVNWIPNDRALLVGDSWQGAFPYKVGGIRLEAKDPLVSLFPEWTSIDYPRFHSSGRVLYFGSLDQAQDPTSPCFESVAAGGGRGDLFALRTLHNTGTVLRARRVQGVPGYVLEGTAADKNFLRYRLDYSNVTNPNLWLPIAPPSSMEVFDSRFGSFVPPGPGTWVVRLTVEDRAGNEGTATARVSSAESPTLSEFWVSPTLISPNGDGRLEATSVHYRVHQPTHIRIEVADVNGAVVRVLTRSHPAATEETIVWDGRDEGGRTLRDGNYTVRLQGFEEAVEIDTTPPALHLDWSGPVIGCDAGDFHQGTERFVTPLESASAETLADWTGISSFECEFQCEGGYVRLRDSVGRSLRTTAMDAAGNQAVAVLGSGPQWLRLGRVASQVSSSPESPVTLEHLGCAVDLPLPQSDQPIELETGGLLRFSLGEAIVAPISELVLQYRRGGASIWNESPLTSFYRPGSSALESSLPQHVADITWDPAPLVGLGVVEIKLRATDIGGARFESQVTRLLVTREFELDLSVGRTGVETLATVDAAARQRFVKAAVAAGAIEDSHGLVAIAALRAAEVPEDVSIYLQSPDDPRYLTPRRFEPVFDGVEGDVRLYLFRVREHDICATYNAQATARLGSDPVRVLNAADELPVPCFAVGLEKQRVQSTSCSDPIADELVVSSTVSVEPDATAEFQILTLGFVDEAGEIQLLASENRPTAGRTYSHQVDLESLPSGSIELVAELRSVDGHERSAGIVIEAESAPPTVTFDSAGEAVCPGLILASGTVHGAPEPGENSETGFGVSDLPAEWYGVSSLGVSFEGNRFAIITYAPATGETRLNLGAWDEIGNLGCGHQDVELLPVAPAPSASVSDPLISPNDDGLLDRTGVTFETAGLATLRARLLDELGSPLRTLYEETSEFSGTVAFDWDGRDASGAVVPDGAYTILLDSSLDCLEWTRALAVEVDNTPPTVDVASPSPGDPLPAIVTLAGTVSDQHLSSWVLEYGSGDEPAAWLRLSRGEYSRPGPFDPLGSWKTAGLFGVYTVRLRAADRAGNESETRRTFDLTERQYLISALEATPDLFSPNGDDRRESVAITTTVDRDAHLTIEIRSENGTLISTLRTSELVEEGSSTTVWAGNLASGDPAPDGLYRVVARASLATDPLNIQEESVPITLDRTPPTFTLTRPAAGFATASGFVTGSVRDRHLVDWSVELADDPLDPAWFEIARGVGERVDSRFGPLEGLEEGDYALRLTARDAAEIELVRVVPFEIDNTRPTVDLTAPDAGALLSAVSGVAALRGAIEELHLREWRLELGAGSSPTTWIELVVNDQLPESDLLLEWLPTGVPDGAYTLRLSATDLAGNAGADQVAIVLDNTPPEVAISSPAESQGVTAAFEVTGTARDQNFESFVLSVSPVGEERFTAIGGGGEAVSNGLLAEWFALPVDGTYRLRLEAFDLAGNRAHIEIDVLVDTHPPAPPVLQGRLEEQRNARLDWSASSESDLAGYLVERNGVQVTPQPIASNWFFDPGLADGSHDYRVFAVDVAGGRSEPSNVVTLSVDTTPPSAILFAPAADSAVGGVVAIVGTAASDDLREFQLTVRPETGGAAVELRRSTLSVAGEKLSDWSTIGLAEGAPFLVRLEAGDLSGNVGVAENRVTIDNARPAAPLALTATVPTGTRTINTAWTKSIATDVYGYLLYRDGILVTDPAGSASDLRDVALPATGNTYADLNLPDGTYAYVVYAIDRAGNLSLPSNTATATINRRAPHAVITQPLTGEEFDGPLYVLAECPDLDVASVTFEWRPLGTTPWAVLAPADLAAPWETTFDPSAFEPDLAHGSYELRAVARDRANAVDPAPTQIVVVYVDRTAPPAPLEVLATADGGEVTVDWTPSEASDFAGYEVDRIDAAGATTRISPSLLAVPGLVDSGVEDGEYQYVVWTVDQAGNRSSASDSALVATPVLETPFSPTRNDSFELRGTSSYRGAATAEWTRNAETVAVDPTPTDTDGSFTWSGLPLAVGLNQFDVRVEEGADRTRSGEARVTRGERPAPPTALVAEAGAGWHEVALDWEPSSSPGIAGYRLDRNGEPIPAPQRIEDAIATADNMGFLAPLVLDGDPWEAWWPTSTVPNGLDGESIEIEWSGERLLRSVTIDWYVEDDFTVWSPGDYDLEGWFDGAWRRLAEFRGAQTERQTWTAGDLFPTDRIRVVLRGSIYDAEDEAYWVGLSEIRIEHQPLIPSADQARPVHDATATAAVAGDLAHLALDGDPDEAWWPSSTEPDGLDGESIEFSWPGVRPVTSVTIDWYEDTDALWAPTSYALEAWSQGAWTRLAEFDDIATTRQIWTASQPFDTDQIRIIFWGSVYWPPGNDYWVGLGEVRIDSLPPIGEPDFVDIAPSGELTYRALAVSTLGFESEPSEPVTLTVASAEPPLPVELVAIVSERDVALTWSASASEDVARYELFRDGISLGVTAASSERAWLDPGRPNGTYVYVVVAVDREENRSVPSNQAVALVDVEWLHPPRELVVTSVSGESSLDLAWLAPEAGTPPVAYQVYRSLAAGGPFEAIDRVPQRALRDVGLASGSTYHYFVTAIDSFERESEPSNRASGTVYGSTRPPAPAITHPTIAGVERTVGSSIVDVSGLALPGVQVELKRDGRTLGSGVASPAAASRRFGDGALATARARMAPDGDWIWVAVSGGARLVRVDSGEIVPSAGAEIDARWSRYDGALYAVTSTTLVRHEVEPIDESILATADAITAVAPSPDGAHVALIARRGTQSGVWIYDLGTGDWSLFQSATSTSALGAALEWSPLGTELAYQRTGSPTRLEVAFYPSGALRAANLSSTTDAPSWSPDGSQLLWSAPTPTISQIWRLDLATGQSAAITSGSTAYTMPSWSSDGLSYLRVRAGSILEQVSVATSLATGWATGSSGTITLVESTPSGRVGIVQGARASILTPAGRFVVRDVELAEGDNRLHAVAWNAGVPSDPSSEVVVRLAAGSLPNLLISDNDLLVVPAVPGIDSVARVTVVVRNVGGAAAAASTLTVGVSGPNGYIQLLAAEAPIPPLASGAARQVAFDLQLPSIGGRFVLSATADPLDRLAEAIENDNDAVSSFVVAESALPQLELSTDKSFYDHGEVTEIVAVVVNPGERFDGSVRVVLEDSEGYLVEDLGLTSIEALDFGETVELRWHWSNAEILAGGFRARAILVNDGLEDLAEATAAFTVGEALTLALDTTTDRPSYLRGESARLTARFEYLAGNVALESLTLDMEVESASGQTVLHWTELVGTLLPGASGSSARTTSTEPFGTGTFRLRATLSRTGSVLATASALFSVEAEAPAVSGSLEVATSEPSKGSDLDVLYRVQASGSLASPVPIRVRTIEPSTAVEVARVEQLVELDASGAGSGNVTFETTSLELRRYVVVLESVESEARSIVLATASFRVIDTTPPTAELVRPLGGALLGGDVDAQAVAHDLHSRVERVDVSVDGGEWQPLRSTDASRGHWGGRLATISEGEHVARVRAHDSWSNVFVGPEQSFEVDRTPPVVSVAGVEDGGHYADPVRPTITIAELHPGWEQILLDGAAFESGDEVSTPGEHLLRVVAEDAVGNRATAEVRFALEAPARMVVTKQAVLAVDADLNGVPSPGDRLRYEIEISNPGRVDLHQVVVRDLEPEHAAIDESSVLTDRGFVSNRNPIEVEVGLVPGDSIATVHFEVVIAPVVPLGVRTIVNQAFVSSAELPVVASDDPAVGGDADPTETTIVAAPRLVVEKVDALAEDVDGDGAASPGDVVEYVVTLRNLGNTSATEVVLEDPVPSSSTIESESVVTTLGVVESEDPVRVLIGELPGAESAEVRFRVRIDDPIAPRVRELSNQATATSAELLAVLSDDPSTGAEADPTKTPVVAAPILALEKRDALFTDAGGDGVASPGDVLLYRLTLRNTGNTAATDVALDDPLDPDAEIEPGSLQTSAGTIESESPLRILVGELAADASVEVTYRARIRQPFPIERLGVANQATATSWELAPEPSDDPDTEAALDPTTTDVFITPSLSVIDAAAPESAGELTFRFELSEPSNRPVELLFTTGDGSAVTPHDYGATSAAITIPPGSTLASVPVPLVDDLLDEDDEQMGLSISSVAGAVVVDGFAVGTIVDDDLPPTITIADGSLVEGNAGTSPMSFAVALSAPSGRAIAVGWTTANVDANAPADYLAGAGLLELAPGETLASIPVAIVGDLSDERNETFAVRFTSATNVTIADGEAVGTIVDDDLAQLSIGDRAELEGDSGTQLVQFTLTLAEPAALAVSVDYRTEIAVASDAAHEGVDFEAVTGTISIAPGGSTASIAVPFVGDLLYERDERFRVVLSNPVEAAFVDGEALGTIVNDDAPPAISIGDASVVEGDDGLVDLLFPVSLSAESGLPAELRYQTSEGSATSGVDYLAFTGHLAVAAGATDSTIRIEVVGDTSDELDETFEVVLSQPVDATVADGSATGTILDDDLAQVSIGDVEVLEGDSGTTLATFAIRLAEPAAETVTFDWTTAQDSATEGFDYEPGAGVVTILAGEDAAEVSVDVIGDSWFEEDERFFVRLTNPAAAEFLDGEGVGTILNDEGCASANLVVNGGAETVGGNGKIVAWTELVGAWKPRYGGPAPAVEKAYFDGAPEPLAELVQTISLTAFSRQLDDGDGTLLASLWLRQSAAGGGAAAVFELLDAGGFVVASETFGPALGSAAWEPFQAEIAAPATTASARIRLLGDGYFDGVTLRVAGVPTLVLSDAWVNEPTTGTALLPFVATLSCPIEPTLRFDVATSNVTATAGLDYQSTAGKVSIPRGELTAPIPVPALPDTFVEGHETMRLDVVSGLSVPWVVLADGRGVGTIVDGDFCRRTIGYWKEHPEAWPISSMRLGSEQIDSAAMMSWLAYTGGNVPSRLAQQLVATKLNLAMGSPPSIVPTVEAADAYLVQYPPGTSVSGAARTEADRLKSELDVYNNGCTLNQ